MKDPLGLGRMRTLRARFWKTCVRARSVQFPTVRANRWGPMGAGDRLAESCASVLPYAMGRRSLLFLEACRAACATATTFVRSFQDGERNTVSGQKLEKIRLEYIDQK